MALQTGPLGFNKVKYGAELFVKDRWYVSQSSQPDFRNCGTELTFCFVFPRAGVAPVEGADQKETA